MDAICHILRKKLNCCSSFQSLIHTLDIVPEGADSTDPCARDALAATEVPVKDQSTKAQ